MPAGRVDVLKTAEPAVTVAVPRTPKEDSRKTTLPLVVDGDTVAVRDVVEPKMIWAGCATKVVVVKSAVMVTVAAALVDGRSVGSPE